MPFPSATRNCWGIERAMAAEGERWEEAGLDGGEAGGGSVRGRVVRSDKGLPPNCPAGRRFGAASRQTGFRICFPMCSAVG